MHDDGKASGNLRLFSPLQRSLARWLDLSGTVPGEHTQLLSQLDQTTGEIGGHRFNIGQAVQFSPQCARGAPGLYVVTALLPERDGEFEYSIRMSQSRTTAWQKKANCVSHLPRSTMRERPTR
jgi:hypothetical protein